MGRKKSTRSKIKKKTGNKSDLKKFNCLVCYTEKSIECSINKINSTGYLECKSCNIMFKMPINSLSENVDIYHGWIDSLEENKK